jgi:NAD(P)H-nitrite reductase large subunit
MDVLVVGSGIAGVSFAEEFRKLAPDHSVTLLTAETLGYYSRPLLSHGFTRDDIETRIILRRFDQLEQTGIRVLSGREAVALDPAGHRLDCRAEPDQTASLAYDRLVLAPGSAALIPPPFLGTPEKFKVLNSLTDLIGLRRLRDEVRCSGSQPRWAVIGGGLIGCEAASDLARAGDRVTLFHALPRLMERQLVEEDSADLLAVLQNDHVDVRLDAQVQGFAGEPANLAVVTQGGMEDGFHGILVACGFKPRIEVARNAGIATRRGIVVDTFLATDASDVYAIGDAAECADGRLYAYVTPIRSQALWLARHLAGLTQEPWQPPAFKPKAKVHGFTAVHPYLF